MLCLHVELIGEEQDTGEVKFKFEDTDKLVDDKLEDIRFVVPVRFAVKFDKFPGIETFG